MAKKCKCNIMSFGQINLYLLLIPLGAVFDTSIDLVLIQSNKFGQKGVNKQQHPIIMTINYSLGSCLSFIFFIIYKVCTKRNEKTNIFLFDKIMNKFNKNNTIKNKEIFLWILLGSVLDFISKIIYYYNWIESGDYLNYRASNILLMSLFSYWLLKMKLYKHHYLSIGVITIIGIATNFIYGYFTLEKLKQNLIGYIINFFGESITNIMYVLYKFFMFKKFIKSFSILFFQGLIELILGIITLVISTQYFSMFDSYKAYFSDLDTTEIIIFFSLILLHFITFVIVFIIIDIYTPFHVFLLMMLSYIINPIFNSDFWINKTEKYIIIFYWIFLIINIFMTLIYIEIIQLNFCGLSYMTKKNIEERAKLDSIDCPLNIRDDDYENDNDIENNSLNQSNDTISKNITMSGYSIELKNINNDKLTISSDTQ